MISFKTIPGHAGLFLDFLYDFEKVSGFYRGHYQKSDDVHRRLQELEDFGFRDILPDVLHRQNGDTSAKTKENIRLLSEKTTVAVVTGQQMGLLGGPLFTLYKAMGIIRYCERLKKDHPDYNFVPIFWLELEDHDFDEIRSIRLIDINNDLRTLSYDGDGNDKKMPIHEIKLTNDIMRVHNELKEVLYKTDFSASWQTLVGDTYAPGQSMGEAFRGFLQAQLGKHGLVTINPSDPELKKIASPIFEKELTHPQTTLDALKEQSALLSKNGYQLQVDPDSTNLFLTDNPASPLALNRTGSRKFRLKSDDISGHLPELRKILADSPERFIPNVILRPIVQDHLLPTFAYMGGPAEIAYFAQFGKVYDVMNVKMPLIVPRPFVTIIEKKIAKVLDKFRLKPEDVLIKGAGLIDELAKSEGSESAPAMVGKLGGQINSLLSDVKNKLASVDQGLKGATETAGDKITQALQVLQTKAAEAEKRAAEQRYSQLTKALTHLRPENGLQERTLNVLYYLNKYGPEIVDKIFDGIEPVCERHQVLYLD